MDKVPVNSNVTITGKLTDDEGKPIANVPVDVIVDNKIETVTTDKEGNYEATLPVDKVGEIPVTVEFRGNDVYEPTTGKDTIDVFEPEVTVDVKVPEKATANKPVNVTGKVTDQDGKPVPNAPVNVTVNGKTYPTTTDKNGNFKVPVDNIVTGKNNVTVTAGNTTTGIDEVNKTINADKQGAKLTVNDIPKTSMDKKPVVTGKLTDDEGKPIADAEITITVNGEEFKVTTDSKGNYELEVPNAKAGQNNVTVKFVDDNYKTATVDKKFDANKVAAIVKVESVIGTVGEDITLVAHVTDEKGNKITGGNLVFKLNGRSLREDGRFDTDSANVIKFHVENGLVTFTMKADLYLRAGKNITASYSGSSVYESAKGNVAVANIRKRNANVVVTVTPNPAKQNTDIVFTATLTDVTKNAKNTTCLTTNGEVIFKINGVTIKDKNGANLKIPVEHSVVNYVYHVPTGTAGINEKGIRNYTVEAVYNNSMFYPDSRNTTTYNVERSIVNVNFESASVKNDVLSVKATFTDYENNNLVGTNKICVKINGKTYQENGKTKYFNVRNGNVDLTGIKLSSGTKVKSVTLVTGDRQAYLSARATTTDITTS